MDLSQDVLRKDERAIISLRSLYRQFGYTEYRMSRFEEYGLYSDNKAFLSSGDIITFTGTNGKLMALRPDVTLSIVKNIKDDGSTKKLYYNENIYRPDGHEFKEQMQVGLECIGNIGLDLMCEVLLLAQRSLGLLGESTRLDVSHMGFLGGLLQQGELTHEQRLKLLLRIGEKNIPELGALCSEYRQSDGFRNRITALASLCGPFDAVIAQLCDISVNNETGTALQELKEIREALRQRDTRHELNLDFSIVNDLRYYSGIIFQGFIEGISSKVLSGGRYDELLRKFGKRSGAVGFAVYLDLLDRFTPQDKLINIALPKGRLGEKAYAVFGESGYECPGIREESRRLVFENLDAGVRYFWVKPSDVAIYVQRGVADIGVVGKDILLENSTDVYELLDLGLGKCRMCVAAEKGFTDDPERTLRVATKFPGVALDHFEKAGREIDIIKLNGSIELAPLLGLSDVIVDIVETGGTLRENDLEVIETIADISARLVSNKVSYKFNRAKISELCINISETLKNR